MNTQLASKIRMAVVCVCGLFILLLFSACAGVATTGGTTNGSTSTITGKIQSVNAQAHSVTLLVNGQQITVSGLSDQQISALQSQVNKTYSIQVTSSGTNSYTINAGTNPQENDNENTTPTAANASSTNAAGTIEFTGKVQSYSGSTIIVQMPDGQSLNMSIVNGQADLSDLNGASPSVGQMLKVSANADASGNYTVNKVSIPSADDIQKDQNTVQYQGITTSAVSTSNQISFKVGNKSYTYRIGTGADLKDFSNNAQAIGANIPVKVTVAFANNTGTVTSVGNNANN